MQQAIPSFALANRTVNEDFWSEFCQPILHLTYPKIMYFSPQTYPPNSALYFFVQLHVLSGGLKMRNGKCRNVINAVAQNTGLENVRPKCVGENAELKMRDQNCMGGKCATDLVRLQHVLVVFHRGLLKKVC